MGILHFLYFDDPKLKREELVPVSYTHLDVYKRQKLERGSNNLVIVN